MRKERKQRTKDIRLWAVAQERDPPRGDLKRRDAASPRGGGSPRTARPTRLIHEMVYYRPMSNQAYIFDMDGVLADNCRYHVLAWRVFSKKHGFELTD